jgi:hypothetical protein
VFVVPELSALALLRLVDPSAVDLIPLEFTLRSGVGRQADADVSPVIIVEAWVARVRHGAALAPGFVPVEVRFASLRVTLAGTLVSVPVEADRAGLGGTVAHTALFTPEETWLAWAVGLDAAARANVESPLDLWVGNTIHAVSETINGHALALAEPLVPVHGPHDSLVVVVTAFLEWATALAARLVPLLALAQAVIREDRLHADASAVILAPELTCRAVDRCAHAGANILVPHGSVRAHRWAALALTSVVVPDHHVTTVLGHAEALAT